MSDLWRVIDTGLRPAAQNIALNRALLEARCAEEIPSTLRFLRFAPSALLGCRQSAEQEIDRDYCRDNGITLQRRITGGSALYVDEAQLGWELYLHQRDVATSDMLAVARRICHAAATAVSALGIDARYRPRDDIEVDGRKISSSGGASDGDALLFQGMLLLESDTGKALRVLRAISGQTIASARERVASLKELLGRRPDLLLIKRNLIAVFESEFNVEFQEGDLTLTENARYRKALAEIDTPDWIDLVRRPACEAPLFESAQQFAGGMLRASLMYDRLTHRIKQIGFSGDFRIDPRRVVPDLEAALRDTSVERLEHNVRVFFSGRDVDMRELTPEDFIAVVRLAVKQPIVASSRT